MKLCYVFVFFNFVLSAIILENANCYWKLDAFNVSELGQITSPYLDNLYSTIFVKYPPLF